MKKEYNTIDLMCRMIILAFLYSWKCSLNRFSLVFFREGEFFNLRDTNTWHVLVLVHIFYILVHILISDSLVTQISGHNFKTYSISIFLAQDHELIDRFMPLPRRTVCKRKNKIMLELMISTITATIVSYCIYMWVSMQRRVS